MDIFNELEYYLPKLNINKNFFEVNASGNFEDTFIIKNIGKNLLKGEIISNNKFIKVSPEKFEGNNIEAKINIDLINLNSFNIFNSEIFITSNGGEEKIKLIIYPLPSFLKTKNKQKILSLKDFYDFSKENPVEARFIFASQDFMIWLYNTKQEYIEIYEKLIKFSNKEKALDDFFQFTNLKQKSYLKFEEEEMKIYVEPLIKEIVPVEINIKKEGYGYIKKEITQKEFRTWISLTNNSLSSSDFLEGNKKTMDFYINTNLLEKKYNYETLEIENTKEKFEIIVIKKNIFEFELSKKSYNFIDKGILNIKNNTGKKTIIEINADKFVEFEGTTYEILETANIPFNINYKSIFNKNIFESKIIFTCKIDNKIYKEILEFNIGSVI